MTTGFLCTQCGLCCRNLHRNDTYKHLDRGDGVCRHLDEQSNLCTIYDSRPLICRVDAMYDVFFAQSFTREEYYALNRESCKALQQLASDEP